MRAQDFHILEGDSAEVLKTLDDNSFDSIVCDPPAGISFFGNKWDDDKGGRDQWIDWLASVMRDGLRVLKPGGHALVWALPRTSHWTGMALERAGFEIRDRITHMFSSGYPKSPNIGKMIDRVTSEDSEEDFESATTGLSDDAKRWLGWGTSVKPAGEDWWLCRKPLSEKLIAANVLKWGTGGMNINGTRVVGVSAAPPSPLRAPRTGLYFNWGKKRRDDEQEPDPNAVGRWPANVVLSHSSECKLVGTKTVTKTDERQGLLWVNENPDIPEIVDDWRCSEDCAVRCLNDQGRSDDAPARRDASSGHGGASDVVTRADYLSEAEVSRFFYCSKAGPKERWGYCVTCEVAVPYDERIGHVAAPHKLVVHPTQKSEDLMRYLIRLITPPGGRVLDPFGGSGSTLIAARAEGFSATIIEKDPTFVKIARGRLREPRG